MYTKMEKSLEQKLASAEEYAQKGDACIMDAYLSSAQTCAQKVGRDISEESRRIQKTGYANAVSVKLKNAGKYAGEGNEYIMDVCLDLAQIYAQKVGRDISAEVQKIKKILKNRIELST